MLNLERKDLILQMLDLNTSVSIRELTEKLEVSEVTIRRILNDMDRQQLLHRTRGGAVSITMPIRESNFHTKKTINITQKKEIARTAYEYINDNDTIFLDAGTTTLELVKIIRSNSKRNIMIVTNAINIAYELIEYPHIQVIVIGGELRHGLVSCVGHIAEQALASLYFDKTFLSANNLSLKFGATTPNLQEAQFKRCAVATTGKSYLLCDSSKFVGISTSKIVPLSAFDTVITDSKIDETTLNEYLQAGINICKAKNS